MSFDAPAKTNPREYPHEPYIPRNYSRLIGLHFAADSMGLSLFKFVQWAPKDAHLFCNRVLAENGFWFQIAAQGHSRSFILQSVSGQQGVAYRYYNTAGLISEDSEEVATQMAKKIAVVVNPTLIWLPCQEEPPLISP